MFADRSKRKFNRTIICLKYFSLQCMLPTYFVSTQCCFVSLIIDVQPLSKHHHKGSKFHLVLQLHAEENRTDKWGHCPVVCNQILRDIELCASTPTDTNRLLFERAVSLIELNYIHQSVHSFIGSPVHMVAYLRGEVSIRMKSWHA